MTGETAIRKLTSVSSALTGMWAPVWRVLSFSPADDLIAHKKTISASIDTGKIAIAYGSRFLSRVSIKGTKEYSFEEGRFPRPEDLVSSLALAANEFRSSATDVTLVIPKAWAIIKTIDFPSTVKENLKGVISYEMDRLTPFLPEEAFFDFRVIKEHGDRITLLLMASRADNIRPYIKALNESGFNVSSITINLSATATLCRHKERKDDVVFIEVNEKGYEGALVEGGAITSVFFENTMGNDGRKKIESASSELKKALELAKGHGRSPHIYALLKDKDPSVRELFKLQAPAGINFLGEKAGDQDMPYAAVGGVLESLWHGARGLNLLKEGRIERPGTPMALTMLLCAGLLAMAVLYIMNPLQVEKKRLSLIENQLMLKKDEVRKVEDLKKDVGLIEKDIAVIDNFKGNRPMALSLFKELTTVIPKTAWLTRVRVTDTTVEIEGYANTATELLPRLESSKLFRKAEFSSPTFRDTRMNSDRFVIKMEIEGITQQKDITQQGGKEAEHGKK